MSSQCRIDGIEEVRPASHAEFMFRSAIFTFTRLADGRTFRVRMPRQKAWRPGDVVTLEDAVLEAEAGPHTTDPVADSTRRPPWIGRMG